MKTERWTYIGYGIEILNSFLAILYGFLYYSAGALFRALAVVQAGISHPEEDEKEGYRKNDCK